MKILFLGRHTLEQVAQLAIEDLDALVTLLGEKKFFFENAGKPHLADLIVYSAIYPLVERQVALAEDCPIKHCLESRPSLVAFFYNVKREIDSQSPPAEWKDF